MPATNKKTPSRCDHRDGDDMRCERDHGHKGRHMVGGVLVGKGGAS